MLRLALAGKILNDNDEHPRRLVYRRRHDSGADGFLYSLIPLWFDVWQTGNLHNSDNGAGLI